jgi:hypothetical protein
VITHTTLLGLLTPTYIKSLPANDGWNRAYDFGMDQAAGSATPAQEYGLRSTGKDGTYSGGTYTAGSQTNAFDCDIVYSNGSFIQWPEGLQSQ